MCASNLDRKDTFIAPRTHIKPWLKYEDMSPLGKQLHDIAKEIELSDDEPAYDMAAIKKELRERRGGFDYEDEDSD
jgi:hypothetical protein